MKSIDSEFPNLRTGHNNNNILIMNLVFLPLPVKVQKKILEIL